MEICFKCPENYLRVFSKIRIKSLLPFPSSDLRVQANQLFSILCLDVISQQAKGDAQEEFMELTLDLLRTKAISVKFLIVQGFSLLILKAYLQLQMKRIKKMLIEKILILS